MSFVDPVLFLSSTKLVSLVVDALKVAWKKKHEAKIKVTFGESTVELDADEFTPEKLKRITELLTSVESEPKGLRKTEDVSVVSPSQRELGALALAISPQAVFSDARQRMSVVFKINLGVAITLAVILLGGLGGAVYSAVFLHNNIWATVFGGVSTADVIGLWALKPLTAINHSLVETQRLEMLQLRLSQQLDECSHHDTLEERIKCQTVVWDTIQKELAILAGPSEIRSKTGGKKKSMSVRPDA